MFWSAMIGNELIGPFCLPKELKLSLHVLLFPGEFNGSIIM